MKKIKASIRSFMSTIFGRKESTKKGLKSASFGLDAEGQLFSYNVLALCKTGEAGKLIKETLGDTRTKTVPQNDEGKWNAIGFPLISE